MMPRSRRRSLFGDSFQKVITFYFDEKIPHLKLQKWWILMIFVKHKLPPCVLRFSWKSINLSLLYKHFWHGLGGFPQNCQVAIWRLAGLGGGGQDPILNGFLVISVSKLKMNVFHENRKIKKKRYLNVACLFLPFFGQFWPFFDPRIFLRFPISLLYNSVHSSTTISNWGVIEPILKTRNMGLSPGRTYGKI